MFLLNISFFYIFSHVLCLLIDNYFNISSTQEVYQFSIQYQSISILIYLLFSYIYTKCKNKKSCYPLPIPILLSIQL